MSSFQGVRIEEFYCIQRCPHFRGGVPLYTEVALFQGIEIEKYVFLVFSISVSEITLAVVSTGLNSYV